MMINRRARHDYHILDTFEAGMVLRGPEVKSLRQNRVSFTDSYARVRDGEVYVYNLHIAPYDHTTSQDVDSKRERKLLLHRREIRSLTGTLAQKGLTLIPLRIYFRRGKAKLELGLARGKHLYDKRQKLKERIVRRQIDRAMKGERV